jgi:hypothetical protein
MDVFAHAAWTNLIFYKKLKQRKRDLWVAVLFGVLPDLLSFAPVFIYSWVFGTGFMELIGRDIWVMRFAAESYKYTHSIVIFAILIALVAVIRKYLGKNPLYLPILAFGLHTLIDIPTHKNFYETPFLFPLSDYTFSYGVSWAHPVFMAINYSLLAIFYVLLTRSLFKQK